MADRILNRAYTIGTIDGAQDVTPGVAVAGFRDFSSLSGGDHITVMLVQDPIWSNVRCLKTGSVLRPVEYFDGSSGMGVTVTFSAASPITVFGDLAAPHFAYLMPSVKFGNSDATPSVKTCNNFTCADTAPAAITTFDNMLNGQKVLVKPGAQAQVFTHSAGFKMPNGVDFTLATTAAPVEFFKQDDIVYMLGGGSVSAADLETIPNYSAQSELTVATGAITPTKASHTVDTEADDPTDDLDTVTLTNFNAGDVIELTVENASRVVTVKNGTGNITTLTGTDIVLNGLTKSVRLKVDDAGTGVVAYEFGDAATLQGNAATAFATAAQGTTADSALQPADVDKAFVDALGVDAASVGGTTPSTFGKSLIDDADAAAARATLEVYSNTQINLRLPFISNSYSGADDDAVMSNALAALEAVATEDRPQKLVTLPKSASDWSFDDPIRLPSFSTLDFTGVKILHTSAGSNVVEKSSFIGGGYGPVELHKIPSGAWTAANAIDEGDSSFTTTTAGDASNFSAGDIVFIRNDTDYLAGGYTRYTYWQTNKVAVNGVAGTGVVALEEPISEAHSTVLVINASDYPLVTFDGSSSSVIESTGADYFDISSHGFADAEAVIYENGGGTDVGGLTGGNIYYIRDSAANRFKVSSTSGGAAVTISGVGTGAAHKFTRVMYLDDASTGSSQKIYPLQDCHIIGGQFENSGNFMFGGGMYNCSFEAERTKSKNGFAYINAAKNVHIKVPIVQSWQKAIEIAYGSEGVTVKYGELSWYDNSGTTKPYVSITEDSRDTLIEINTINMGLCNWTDPVVDIIGRRSTWDIGRIIADDMAGEIVRFNGIDRTTDDPAIIDNTVNVDRIYAGSSVTRYCHWDATTGSSFNKNNTFRVTRAKGAVTNALYFTGSPTGVMCENSAFEAGQIATSTGSDNPKGRIINCYFEDESHSPGDNIGSLMVQGETTSNMLTGGQALFNTYGNQATVDNSTDTKTWTVPAGTMGAAESNHILVAEFWGRFTSGTTPTIQVKLDGTSLQNINPQAAVGFNVKLTVEALNNTTLLYKLWYNTGNAQNFISQEESVTDISANSFDIQFVFSTTSAGEKIFTRSGYTKLILKHEQ